MTAPTYRVHDITATSAAITVTNPDGYYLRLVCRLEDSTEALVDAWVGNGTSYTVTGLSPETTYVLNIGYNETGEGGATFIGATTFTTEAEEEEEPVTGGGGSVYIYDSRAGRWGAYSPYIYDAWEGRWKPYAPYIYSSTTGWGAYS